MPANKDFARRIEILDECFRNRQKKWTLDALINEVNRKLMDRYGVNAGKRTVQNDIKHLIEEKNAPIAKKKEGSATYFYYLDKDFSIKNLPIQEEEVNLLKSAIDILSQVNDFKLLTEVEAIVDKLQNTIDIRVEGRAACIQFEKHTVSTGTKHIDDLFNAIRDQSAIRITYQSFKATQPEESIFHPYLLKEYRNRWFLIGRKESSNQITNMALDRIKRIRNSISPYLPNDLFDPAVYFDNIIGVTFPEGALIQEIKIKCDAKQSPYIKTKPIHHTQKIIRTFENGDIIVSLWLIDNYEFRSTLMSYGCEIEVLSPNTIRNSIRDYFTKGIKRYTTSD